MSPLVNNGCQYYLLSERLNADEGAIHLRHINSANLLYADGHVDAAGVERIKEAWNGQGLTIPLTLGAYKSNGAKININ